MDDVHHGFLTCPSCLLPVQADRVTCPRCQAVYHPACLEQSGCLVPGCTGLPGKEASPIAEPYSPYWPLVYRCWKVGIFILVGAVLLSMTKAWRVGEIVFFLPWMGLLMLTAGGLVHDIIIGPRRCDRFGTAALATLSLSGTGFLFFVGFLAVLFVPLGLVFDRDRRRALRGLGVLGVVGFLASAIAVPSFRPARQRANTRACYANQKTIAGAVEMYNLDKGTKRTLLDAAFFTALKSGGYLSSVPQDPGSGTGSSGNYQFTSGGNGFRCEVHGPIQ